MRLMVKSLITYISYSITILFSLIAWFYFNATEETKYFSYVSILVAISSILYLTGIIARDVGQYGIYAGLSSLAGFVFLAMNFILLIAIHKTLYTRVGGTAYTMLPFLAPIILANGSTKPVIHIIFGFIGMAFALTIISVYMAVSLALERKGGSLFWYLISSYTILVFFVIFSAGLFMFLEEVGAIAQGTGAVIHSSLYAVSSAVLAASGWYYNKVLHPKIQRLKQL